MSTLGTPSPPFVCPSGLNQTPMGEIASPDTDLFFTLLLQPTEQTLTSPSLAAQASPSAMSGQTLLNSPSMQSIGFGAALSDRSASCNSVLGRPDNPNPFSPLSMEHILEEAAMEANHHTTPSFDYDGTLDQLLSFGPEDIDGAPLSTEEFVKEPALPPSRKVAAAASPHSSNRSPLDTPVASKAAAGLLPLPPSPLNADYGWAVNNDDYPPASAAAVSPHAPHLSLHPGEAHNTTPLSPHLLSPTIRVEAHGWSDEPVLGSNRHPYDPLGQAPAKQYQQNPLSPDHLLPPADPFVPTSVVDVSPLLASDDVGVARDSDGTWMPTTSSGAAGLSPDQREALRDINVPSLKEQEEKRQLQEKRAEVERWVTTSAASSVHGGDESPSPCSTPLPMPVSPSRPRSRTVAGGSTCREPSPMRLNFGQRPPFALGNSAPGGSAPEEAEQDVYTNRTVGCDWNEAAPDQSSQPEMRANDPPVFHVHPWDDCPSHRNGMWRGPPMQPPTSNAALSQYLKLADKFETASRCATWGTRRLSDSDVERFVGRPDSLRNLSLTGGRDRGGERNKKKGESIVERITEKFNNLKRTLNDKTPSDHEASHTPKAPDETNSRSSPNPGKPARPGRAGRLSISYVGSIGAMGVLAAVGAGPSLDGAADAPPSSPWTKMGRRSRSKSVQARNPEATDSAGRNLKDLLAQVGGLPVMSLDPTSSGGKRDKATGSLPQSSDDDHDDDHEDDADADIDALPADLETPFWPTEPSPEGFRQHVQKLWPRLDPLLVERVSQEQTVRFQKLVELRLKHQSAVQAGACPSGDLCTYSRGRPVSLFPNPTAGGMGTTMPKGLQAGLPQEDEEARRPDDTAVATANFPANVPRPPVSRLPAEFECPLCFEIKSFSKPSDWTKHVYEDVFPFTCTFSGCSEVRSFKRKADWVRHENELHRHLEWWACNINDCAHRCYRRANFVKHLTREHKMSKDKPNGASPSGSSRGHTPTEMDPVARRADECRHETEKRPHEEPCKFCGQVCSSWKKLTVHLSRHLEQISLPVLRLVQAHFADSSLSNTSVMPTSAAPAVTAAPIATMENPSNAFGVNIPAAWSSVPSLTRPAVSTGPPRYSLPTSALRPAPASSPVNMAVPNAHIPSVNTFGVPSLRPVPGGAPYTQQLGTHSYPVNAETVPGAMLPNNSHHANYAPHYSQSYVPMAATMMDNMARAVTVDAAMGQGYDNSLAGMTHLDQTTTWPFYGAGSAAAARGGQVRPTMGPYGGRHGSDPSYR